MCRDDANAEGRHKRQPRHKYPDLQDQACQDARRGTARGFMFALSYLFRFLFFPGKIKPVKRWILPISATR